MIRHEIDSEQALSLFVQLHKSIYCYKKDIKDIADAIKLVKKLVQQLLKQSFDKHLYQNYV